MARRPAITAAKRTNIRCAVYTRKSTEEGLDQEFNSLDAQYEACAAYIASQRHEGWSLVRDRYDDGGFSGGTMERPGLKRLLADIEAGTVDVIVVYKVDRLTRALSDFARIVDVLDARGASFVSITQSFNTTTSMGRLTLNVLLSFAQFEREVTGERIRDKIAASKAKGMWMGGNPPLGYDVRDRKPVVNEAEAATVRRIMQRYLMPRSGRALVDELRHGLHRTKLHCGRGGQPFRLGGLYHLLRNRTYVGEVIHRGAVHAGEHPPIVERAIWDAVQAALEAGRAAPASALSNHRSLLSGKIRDGDGRAMSPSHAVKNGRRYRYYVTHHSALRPNEPPAARIDAPDLEQAVTSRIVSFLGDRTAIANLMPCIDAASVGRALERANLLTGQLSDATFRHELGREFTTCVTLADDGFRVELDRDRLRDQLGIEHPVDEPDEPLVLTIAATRVRQHKDVRLVRGSHANGTSARNEPLVQLLAEARRVYDAALAGPEKSIAQAASESGICRKRLARLLRIALLAPDIVERCIAGTQPATLTTATLFSSELPASWEEQRRMFATI